MAKRGVHIEGPMPLELAHRLGDPGHRNKGVASAEVGNSITPVAPPKTIPPEGQELWHEVLPVLAKYGGLRDVDLPALEGMCIHYARAKRLEAVVNKQGYFSTGSTGQMVVHPGIKEAREERAAFLRIAKEFGLTWISRSALGLSEATRSAVLAGLEGQIGTNPRG